MLNDLVYLCYIYFLCLQEEATLTSKEADVVSTDETASQEITMETSAVSAAGGTFYGTHALYATLEVAHLTELNADLRPLHL